MIQGGLILNSIINHSAAVKVMAWQPNGRILAIGWADGNTDNFMLNPLN